MPKLILASSLARWLDHSQPEASGEITLVTDGNTVGGVLQQAFAKYPSLRSYVLDDHGIVRHHVAIFVDGISIRNKALLQAPVQEHSEIYIMQALSGG